MGGQQLQYNKWENWKPNSEEKKVSNFMYRFWLRASNEARIDKRVHENTFQHNIGIPCVARGAKIIPKMTDSLIGRPLANGFINNLCAAIQQMHILAPLPSCFPSDSNSLNKSNVRVSVVTASHTISTILCFFFVNRSSLGFFKDFSKTT